MADYQTFEHDGITVESNTATPDEMRAAFELPADDAPAEHDGAPPAESEATPPAEGAPPPPEKEGDEPEEEAAAPPARDEQGRFTKKETAAAQTARRNPEKRIDQAIGRQREAERERDELRARIAALEQARQQPPQQAPRQQLQDQFPAFKTWVEHETAAGREADLERYIDERQDYRNNLVARRNYLAHRETSRLQAHEQRLSVARQQIPNFDELVKADIPITQTVRDAILDSPYSPIVILHLSENPQEAQRLAQLPAAEVAREMGRLEGRIENWLLSAAQPVSGSSRQPVSQAKPPGRPVGSSAAAPDPNELSDDLSVDEYIRRANERDRKAGKRV